MFRIPQANPSTAEWKQNERLEIVPIIQMEGLFFLRVSQVRKKKKEKKNWTPFQLSCIYRWFTISFPGEKVLEQNKTKQSRTKKNLTGVAILAILAYTLNATAENGSSDILHVKISELQEVLPRDTYLRSVCTKWMHAFLWVQPMC